MGNTQVIWPWLKKSLPQRQILTYQWSMQWGCTYLGSHVWCLFHQWDHSRCYRALCWFFLPFLTQIAFLSIICDFMITLFYERKYVKSSINNSYWAKSNFSFVLMFSYQSYSEAYFSTHFIAFLSNSFLLCWYCNPISGTSELSILGAIKKYLILLSVIWIVYLGDQLSQILQSKTPLCNDTSPS